MFLAERRSLERFHLLLNYSGFLIVHYVCNFEAVEYNRERRKSCLVYLAENGCGLILLLCLSPINESWREKKKRTFPPKRGQGYRMRKRNRAEKKSKIQLIYKVFCFLIYFNWRLIPLQYGSVFCHTLTESAMGIYMCHLIYKVLRQENGGVPKKTTREVGSCQWLVRCHLDTHRLIFCQR